MVILGIVAVSALGAISARTTVYFADTLFSAVEEYPRTSRHTLCGHAFECRTNSEYGALENAFATIDGLADKVITDANLNADDKEAMRKFILEGVLLWGGSGLDVRSVVLSALQDASLGQDVSNAIIQGFESLDQRQKNELYALHTLAV